MEKENGASWDEIARNWCSHVQDEQWIWVSAGASINSGTYRVKVEDINDASGEMMSFYYDTSDQITGQAIFLAQLLGI